MNTYIKHLKETRRSFVSKAGHLAMAAVGGTLLTGASCGRKKNESIFEGEPLKVNSDYIPGYVHLHKSGELKKRGQSLYGMMKSCSLCPRECGVSRLKNQKGFCNADSRLIVSSFHPHFGEEPPLVGNGGSGTIFMSNCNLRCVFCINWDVAIDGRGSETSIERLSEMMLSLQNRGCKNINIVTPTHYSPHVLLALDLAAARGLTLPLVWNTSGWEKTEVLEILDSVVDIYLPDFKYSESKTAGRYSSDAFTYPEITGKAMIEMNRQVGRAVPADDGIIYRGLMIRHLVLPGNVEGSIGVMQWIAANLPRNTYINLMSQYRPAYKAGEFSELSRRLNPGEFNMVVKAAEKAGLTNLDIQREFL